VLVDSVQALEEFGKCRMQIPDPVEAWWYDVTRIEYDSQAQAIRLVSDA
jgi:hypothetical protein